MLSGLTTKLLKLTIVNIHVPGPCKLRKAGFGESGLASLRTATEQSSATSSLCIRCVLALLPFSETLRTEELSD